MHFFNISSVFLGQNPPAWHLWWMTSVRDWGMGIIHYNDVIMIAMASQITSLTIVYSTVYSGPDQRKHQSTASLAFVHGIHRWPVNSPHKRPVTRKMFPFDDIIMPFKSIWHCWSYSFTWRYPSIGSLFINFIRRWCARKIHVQNKIPTNKYWTPFCREVSCCFGRHTASIEIALV